MEQPTPHAAPKDLSNVELAVGDEVVIKCRVLKIYTEQDICLQIVGDHAELRYEHKAQLAVNSRLVKKMWLQS